MALAAPQVEPLGAEVIGAGFDSAPRAPDLAPLVDQLAGRAGEGALFRLEGRESDVPERAIGRTGPLAQPSGWPAWARPVRLRTEERGVGKGWVGQFQIWGWPVL